MASFSTLFLLLVTLAFLLRSTTGTAETINLVMLSEAKCPDCAAVLQGPLRTIFNDEDLVAKLDFEFVPWGNAYFQLSDCPKGEFNKESMVCWVTKCQSHPENCFDGELICQHGKSECHLNSVQACVIRHNPSPASYVPFLSCFEGDHLSNLSFGAKCAAEHKIDWLASQVCFSGPKRERLELAKRNALRTIELGGTGKLGTPWVILNGKVVEDPQEKLVVALCDAVHGSFRGSELPRTCRDLRRPNIIEEPQSSSEDVAAAWIE